jgi:membrane protein YqaA with SNARE-associated domain
MIDLFAEAFLARLVPVFSEVTLGAIRHFQLESYPVPALVAALGGLSACAVFYGLGTLLRRLPERGSTPEQRARIERMRPVAREWLPWLLVLSPTPVGGVLVMAAAFFRLDWRMVAAVLIAAETVFRAMPYIR